MTDPGGFDHYATAYDQTVEAAIGASGEPVEYFATLKARLVAERLEGRRPHRILDFGCGIGNTTRSLGREFPQATLVGYDQSAESIAVARTATPNRARIEYRTDRGTSLPFTDEAFDLVFASCVFHHIERADHVAWVREAGRVLAPGGSLFVFEHNPLNPFTLRAVRSCAFDKGVRLLRAGYAAAVLKEAGFKSPEVRYYFFFPRMLRVLRPAEHFLRSIPLGAQYYVHGIRSVVPTRRATST
jgi:ubiquinone/menaquinone biosynthesis C-methylase UbiE